MINNIIEKEIPKLSRKLDRLNSRLKILDEKHSNKESNYTYWGGWEKGYIVAKISEIENQIDFLTNLKEVV